MPQLRTKRPEGEEETANIDKAIAAIEATTDSPKLVTLKDSIAKATAPGGTSKAAGKNTP